MSSAEVGRMKLAIALLLLLGGCSSEQPIVMHGYHIEDSIGNQWKFDRRTGKCSIYYYELAQMILYQGCAQTVHNCSVNMTPAGVAIGPCIPIPDALEMER